MRCDNESGSFCPGSPARKSEQQEKGLPYGVGPGPIQEKDQAQVHLEHSLVGTGRSDGAPRPGSRWCHWGGGSQVRLARAVKV